MGRLPLLFLLLCLLLGGCGPKVKTAAWIVRDQLVDQENIESLCVEVDEAEVETVVVQVRGRADAYYDTELAPRAEELLEAEPFDPLAKFIASCRDKRTIAWLNVYYLWGDIEPPVNPLHTVNANPDWILTDRDGRVVSEYTLEDRALGWIEGIYADPASFAYREHFTTIASEVAEKYPVDGIHLDFVRYPGPAYGQGGMLGVTWRNRYGFDPRYLPAEFGSINVRKWLLGEMSPAEEFITTSKLLWAGLRAEQVTSLVRNVSKKLKADNPDLELSAAVVPDGSAAFVEKGQDWRGWIAEGIIDAIYPMSYYGGPERVRSQLGSIAADARALDPEVKLWAGLGAYIKEAERIEEEADIARELGYDGICLFDAGTIRKEEGGLVDYADSISGYRREYEKKQGTSLLARTIDCNELERALLKAGDPAELPEGWEKLASERGESFKRVISEALPKVLGSLENKGVETLPWVKLAGVFRYLHPLDPTERRAEQLEKIEEARQLLSDGGKMEDVASAFSQGGTRSMGGILRQRRLNPNVEDDALLMGLEAGEISPVFEVSNGFWVYKVIARGEGAKVSLEDAPWEDRRIAFRKLLAEKLSEEMVSLEPPSTTSAE